MYTVRLAAASGHRARGTSVACSSFVRPRSISEHSSPSQACRLRCSRARAPSRASVDVKRRPRSSRSARLLPWSSAPLYARGRATTTRVGLLRRFEPLGWMGPSGTAWSLQLVGSPAALPVVAPARRPAMITVFDQLGQHADPRPDPALRGPEAGHFGPEEEVRLHVPCMCGRRHTSTLASLSNRFED